MLFGEYINPRIEQKLDSDMNYGKTEKRTYFLYEFPFSKAHRTMENIIHFQKTTKK